VNMHLMPSLNIREPAQLVVYDGHPAVVAQLFYPEQLCMQDYPAQHHSAMPLQLLYQQQMNAQPQSSPFSAYNMNLPSDPLAEQLLDRFRAHAMSIHAARFAQLQEEVASLAKSSLQETAENDVSSIRARAIVAQAVANAPHAPVGTISTQSSRKQRNRIIRAQRLSPLGGTKAQLIRSNHNRP